MKKTSALMFIAVCGCFSLCVLVMSLFKSIELAGVNSRIADTRERIEALETENRVLEIKLESIMSLSEIDEFARDKLGMDRVSPEQIYFIELEG